MQVTISGVGGAVSGGRTALTALEAWPFDIPPTVGASIRWTDSASNERRGTIDAIDFDVDRKILALTVRLV